MLDINASQACYQILLNVNIYYQILLNVHIYSSFNLSHFHFKVIDAEHLLIFLQLIEATHDDRISSVHRNSPDRLVTILQ